MNAYAKAAAWGAVAGLRTMSAPAFASRAAVSGKVRLTLRALAVGEMIVDKLPSTPNRTSATGLSARIVSGALVGAAMCSKSGKPRVLCAAIGGLAAVGAAYAGMNLRQSAGASLKVPDSKIALIEDAIVVGLGSLLPPARRRDLPASARGPILQGTRELHLSSS